MKSNKFIKYIKARCRSIRSVNIKLYQFLISDVSAGWRSLGFLLDYYVVLLY